MARTCWLEGCDEAAGQCCSACKRATYCDREHQKAHWTFHKKECKVYRKIAEMDRQFAEKVKRKPPPKPRDTHCSGCGVKFIKGHGDWDFDQKCPDCSYTNCIDCSVHIEKGSCWCLDSNFGHLYCDKEPRTYHHGKTEMYKGEYHPAEVDWNILTYSKKPEAFHPEKRDCNRCGGLYHILKDEFRTSTFPRS